MKDKILNVKNLSVSLQNKKTKKEIVKDINFDLEKGECIGILGESGSGKSITMKAILGLLDTNFYSEGTVIYQNKNLLNESKENIRKLRGKEFTMILQNPMTCFDPLYRIGQQMEETWQAHYKISNKNIKLRSIELLDKMQIQNVEEVLAKYPHELSGGMLQRIMIGLALSMKPEVLIADEPTTAIDAITQFEIMKEFQKIKKSGETSMIFISHDLSVISQIADRILVMNQGKIVDQGDFFHIVHYAKDDYTKQLVNSKRMVMERYHKMIHMQEVIL